MFILDHLHLAVIALNENMRPVVRTDSAFGFHFFKSLKYSSVIFKILKVISGVRMNKLRNGKLYGLNQAGVES